jgi:hypothetical protein
MPKGIYTDEEVGRYLSVVDECAGNVVKARATILERYGEHIPYRTLEGWVLRASRNNAYIARIRASYNQMIADRMADIADKAAKHLMDRDFGAAPLNQVASVMDIALRQYAILSGHPASRGDAVGPDAIRELAMAILRERARVIDVEALPAPDDGQPAPDDGSSGPNEVTTPISTVVTDHLIR